jgi:hypothetical protein
MTKRKMFILIALVLSLVSVYFVFPGDEAAARPPLQMTPGTDPMSEPTVVAPTPLPGSGYMNPGLTSEQMNCPMLSGSMAGMTGMTPMPGMSGSMGMGGMGGMSQMGGMGGMSSMSQMDMSGMSPMQGVNDVLTTGARRNWLFSLNPWWLLGWIVLFGWLTAMLVTAIFLLVRLIHKGRQPQAG